MTDEGYVVNRCFDCPNRIPVGDTEFWLTLNEVYSAEDHDDMQGSEDAPPYKEGTMEDWGLCELHSGEDIAAIRRRYYGVKEGKT